MHLILICSGISNHLSIFYLKINNVDVIIDYILKDIDEVITKMAVRK